jgi:hypothetical protein
MESPEDGIISVIFLYCPDDYSIGTVYRIPVATESPAGHRE